MFVYTVYPTIPHKQRKKATSQVEPVSRIKPIRRVEYNSDPIPAQQTYKTIENNTPDIGLERNNWKSTMDGLYMLDAKSLLLAWRRPKVVVSHDYVKKYHEQLLAIGAKNNNYVHFN